jgi:hypothetical protein
MIKPLIYRPLIVLAICCGEPQQAQSQIVTGPTGAEQWMLGGSSATVSNVFAANNNPAAVTQITAFQAGLYSEQRFAESHLQTADVCAVVPTKYVHVGASVNYFGYAVFNQQRIAVDLAKKLSNTFSLGVQLNYVSTYIQDYGTTGSPVLGLGIYAQPLPKVSLGFVLFKPAQATYGKNTTDRIPTYARLGLVYTMTEKIRMVAEADQQLDQKLICRAGIYYKVHDNIHLALGASTNPTYITCGTAILVKKMKVDLAMSIHETLGITPHLGLVFPLAK